MNNSMNVYNKCRILLQPLPDVPILALDSCRRATRSPSRLAEKMPDASIEPHYDLGKHLYWKPLSTQGIERAARLQLEKKPYPKNTL